mmetsp:Transcript_73521/g.137374  ORF Transcript_73521/g.137374 Transcript_73521/m.137374 type:complete len:167 (-) Transcript_73521:143-643(-)
MGAKLCCDEAAEGEPALVAVLSHPHGTTQSRQNPPVEPQDLDEPAPKGDVDMDYAAPTEDTDVRISSPNTQPTLEADGKKYFKVNIAKGAAGQQKLGLVVYWSQKNGTLMVKTLKPGVVADWNAKHGNIITEGCIITSVNGQTNPHRMADTLDMAQELELRMQLPA